MKKMVLASVGLTLATLMLAGCGSKSTTETANTTTTSSTTTTATKAFDPCSVLTADDVAAIVGDKVAGTSANGPDCTYKTGQDEDGTKVSITPTGGTDEMQSFKKANELLGGIGKTVSAQGDVGKDVQSAITPPSDGAPALGDEAVWGANDELGVRKGDLYVNITPPITHDAGHKGPMMIPDADKKAIAQKLAAAVLAKLAR